MTIEKAIEILQELWRYKETDKYREAEIRQALDLAIQALKQKPKTGHWTEKFNDIEGEVRFTCSSCGEYQLFETDFCPECGAEMSESEEEDV